ncbi:hypothetical protein OG936_37640 [Streptomyces sp. NBC_00846]|uniref:hypothetical protein n=1 Tax=Streptomyces sp. NBC_00846 TaxID=2975849 RepID=UPI0038690C53|nr:hypothetical protein OG936_37640 [Streptomyces sp. NBC_00846]
MTGDYDREIRDLDNRVDSLESDLQSLSDKFGYTGHLDDELRDIRNDISSADSKIEELDDDLQDHIGKTGRAVKRLIGQVQLLEGHLLASGGAQLADLDTFTAEQRQQAAAIERGRHARSVLLTAHERNMHQQRVRRFETSATQHREHQATVIATAGKLTGTAGSRDREQAVTELEKLVTQERRLRQELDQQADRAEEADNALAADAKARAEKQGVIAAGEKAEKKLVLALRSRLSDAVSARFLMPSWFVTVLGSVPPAVGTQKWLDTATHVLLYRLTYNITDPVVALGDKPADRAGRRAEWYGQLAKDLRRW